MYIAGVLGLGAASLAVVLAVQLRTAKRKIRQLKLQLREELQARAGLVRESNQLRPARPPLASSSDSKPKALAAEAQVLETRTVAGDATDLHVSASAAGPDGAAAVAATGPSQDQSTSGVAEMEPLSSPSALDLYLAWCRGGPRPRSNDAIEFAYARYGRSEPPAETGGKATHIVTDAPQASEFVRFSEPGAAEAILLPTPTAHYTPVMAHVFPGLTRDVFTPQHLETLEPSLVRRRDGGEWEVAHD